jgi:hypothetical protein
MFHLIFLIVNLILWKQQNTDYNEFGVEGFKTSDNNNQVVLIS